MRIPTALVILIFTALPLRAEEAKEFGLSVAEDIAASGLLDYILPRFALKTGRRAEIVAANADARLVEAGDAPPVLARGATFYALILDNDNAAARRFADWLASDVGQNTVVAYQPPDGLAFTRPPEVKVEKKLAFEGDAGLGRKVAETHCARCHRIAPELTGMTLGSTPSFAALKALPDWVERFTAFYTLNPHPAFLQVEGISPPFDPARPPPIVPVEITPDEVAALQAYVAGVPAADLGADIFSR